MYMCVYTHSICKYIDNTGPERSGERGCVTVHPAARESAVACHLLTSTPCLSPSFCSHKLPPKFSLPLSVARSLARSRSFCRCRCRSCARSCSHTCSRSCSRSRACTHALSSRPLRVRHAHLRKQQHLHYRWRQCEHAVAHASQNLERLRLLPLACHKYLRLRVAWVLQRAQQEAAQSLWWGHVK